MSNTYRPVHVEEPDLGSIAFGPALNGLRRGAAHVCARVRSVFPKY